MPPRRVRIAPPTLLSTGAGMTAGLEIWRADGRLWLHDRSSDGRFAADVETWNNAVGRLNPQAAKQIKEAVPAAPDAVSSTATTART